MTVCTFKVGLPAANKHSKRTTTITCAVSQFRVCILQRSIWRTHRYYPPRPHISQDYLHFRKRRKTEKMATLRGGDRAFRGPGWQKSWCKDKTSSDTTKKCSKGLQRLSHLTTAEDAFEDCKGRVLRRMQTLNWDTAIELLNPCRAVRCR